MIGRVAVAVPLLTRVLAYIATGSHVPHHAFVLTELSEAVLLVGRTEEASALTERLYELSRTHTGRGFQAHAYRLLGEVAMRRDPPEIDQAKTHYQQALALANELDMRSLQAHCHRGLGALYNQTGQAEQARVELSAAVKLYHDMEMTFFLVTTGGGGIARWCT
jgi:tetratricopeptide (TPR) repeat protein